MKKVYKKPLIRISAFGVAGEMLVQLSRGSGDKPTEADSKIRTDVADDGGSFYNKEYNNQDLW